MKLKEKTHKRFVEFFAEKSRAYPDQEFEMAYAEIQRSTGTASVTLKRALQALTEEGVIQMVPGRNSRYARFVVLSAQNSEQEVLPSEIPVSDVTLNSLEQEIDLLKRRIRSQEVAVALLQDRIADLEEKLKK